MISLQLEMNKQGERQVKLKNSQQLNKDKMEICAKKIKIFLFLHISFFIRHLWHFIYTLFFFTF